METKETTAGTLVSLITWKINFDIVASVLQLLVQSDRQIFAFVNSSYQIDLFLASLVIIYQVSCDKKRLSM